MSKRSVEQFTTLPVRALYPVRELARAAGLPSYTLLRLMRRCKVRITRIGRACYVPLSEIGERIPSLWRGIYAAEELRRAVAEGAAPQPSPATAQRSSHG